LALPDTDLRLFFEVLPTPYVILTPDLKIVSANDAYLRVTMTSRSEIIGRQLFEIFPDNPGDPGAQGEAKLRASLGRAMRVHGTDVMPILRHDMRLPGGEFVKRFWSPSITTMWRPEGELAYIALHIEDVTELVRATQTGAEHSQATQQLQARYDQTKLQSLARERMLLDRIAADRERLQGLVEAKDEFLEIVSHELRTPLTIIRGDALILLRPATVIDEEMRLTALTDIADESERISAILDNLLILARPELNQVAPAEPCNVIRLAERALADHGRQFPERSLKVEYDDTSVVVVDSVETYVTQVLQNLLSNAEKYSPKGEPIIVRIESGDAESRICVLDSGKGFTPEEASRVFEPFFRIKDERSHRPGLGVGLSVCKRLVEVMGGSIWAKSRPEGGGEVGFSLPFDPSSVNEDQ
jgi:signal transduction histidine kinase